MSFRPLLAFLVVLLAGPARGEHEEVADMMERWHARASFWGELGHPTLGPDALEYGYRTLGENQFDEAVRLFRLAVKKDRQDIGALAGLGIGLYGSGNNQLAGRAMQRAARLASASASRLEAEAKENAAFNRTQQVVNRSIRAATLERRMEAGVYNVLGRAHFEMQDWDGAIRALEESVKADPTVPEAYEWMARAYDRSGDSHKFLSSWTKAIELNPMAQDRNVWPVFCITIQDENAEDTPRKNIMDEKAYLKLRATQGPGRRPRAKRKKAIPGAGDRDLAHLPHGRRLKQLVRHLRRHECTAQFIHDRNQAMHEYYAATGKQASGTAAATAAAESKHSALQAASTSTKTPYSYINFAYGMVFYHGFMHLFEDRPFTAEAMQRARAGGLDFVALGSNIGTEAFYAALTYEVPVVGYDVLCNLVAVADDVVEKFQVPGARFVCGDALEADLSNAGVVWIDNQSWDEHLINGMFDAMAKRLPAGAVVIDYAVADYHSTMNINMHGMFDVVGCASLPVSWDNTMGTVVTAFKKRAYPLQGNYNNFLEFAESVAKALDSARRMVASVPEAAESPVPASAVSAAGTSGTGSIGGATAAATTATAERIAELVDLGRTHGPEVYGAAAVTDEVMALYQRVMFNWHCHTFQDLHGPLSAAERDYVYEFFAAHGPEHRAFNLAGTWVGNRMASHTYSHRVIGVSVDEAEYITDKEALALDERVDHRRFRLGTTSQPERLWRKAAPVLESRGIALDPYFLVDRPDAYSFYGLGWDLDEDMFKVYLMVHDMKQLPVRLQDLIEGEQGAALSLQHGLVSFTYARNGTIDEEKVRDAV